MRLAQHRLVDITRDKNRCTLHAALDCGPDISLALNNGAASTDLSANVTQAHGLTILTGQTLVPELAGGPLVRSCS